MLNDPFGVEAIAERKLQNERLADADDDFELKKRSNIASATNRHKIHVFDTGGIKFASEGLVLYDEFREYFFEICEAEGILLDLLFCLFTSKILGLEMRGRHGPIAFKANAKLPPNPYGLSMTECEKEAMLILRAMIKDRESPLGISYQTAIASGAPILSVFSEYDPIFFSRDSDQICIAREAYEKVTINDTEAPYTTKARMDKLRNVWNQARGNPVTAPEEIPLILKAVNRGNMRPHFRRTISEIKDSWAEDGKDVEVESSRLKLCPVDTVTLWKALHTKHKHLVEDKRIGPPLAGRNASLGGRKVKFNTPKSYHAVGGDSTKHLVDETDEEICDRIFAELEDSGTLQSFASILQSKSGVMVGGSVPGKQPPGRTQKKPHQWGKKEGCSINVLLIEIKPKLNQKLKSINVQYTKLYKIMFNIQNYTMFLVSVCPGSLN